MNVTATDLKAIAKKTVAEVSEDDVTSLSAAIAYYTVFSLPPLLVVIVAMAGAVFGVDRVQGALVGQVGDLVGPEGAEAIRTMIENASTLGSGIGGKLLGLAALLFGATGAFGQLQKALNRAWEVDEAASGGGLATLVMKRVLSFGMVLTIAFLLLVSLAMSAVLSAVGDAAGGLVPNAFAGTLVDLLNTVVSLGVVALLFALMFRTLPDADVRWRDVWVGAFATAVLFTLGKFLIGLYLGRSDPGSAFGAAGSLALILIWIYYSALIVLVGAEFTQAWAERVGGGIEPDPPGGDDGTEPTPPPPPPAGDGAARRDLPMPTVAHPLGAPRDPAPY
ncbi:MAG: YihY/virulence factor BrkB family protein [Bacteroidota bacterium]